MKDGTGWYSYFDDRGENAGGQEYRNGKFVRGCH